MSERQIFYSNWNQPVKPGHENYWQDVEDIAEWIGHVLEGPTSGFGINRKFSSTIAVQQTKVKFGEIRIYCTLACEEHVETLYQEQESQLSREEFAALCLKDDQLHYHRTYLTAQRLWPQYRSVINSCADYRELTFPTPNDFIDHIERSIDLSWDDYVGRDAARELKRARETFQLLGWDVTLLPTEGALLSRPRPTDEERRNSFKEKTGSKLPSDIVPKALA